MHPRGVWFLAAMALIAAECKKKPALLADGSACTTHESCRSQECRDGVCRGSACSCPGASCADCNPGWRCEARDTDWVEKGVQHVTGMKGPSECYAPCGACPLSTECDKASGLCRYVPFWDVPRVDIDQGDAGPWVAEGNVTLHATARARAGGSIVSYAWSVDAGAVGSGPSIVLPVHADTDVTVTVTDDHGKTAAATRPVWVKTH